MGGRALAALVFGTAFSSVMLLAVDSTSNQKPSKSKTVSAEERIDALSRATVWQPPPPIARASFAIDPKQPKEISCTFEISQLNGTAPKFECRLPDGDKIRVKYGRSPEIPSEVASTRLLHALGFGADNMTLVEKVRCYGCPAEPFMTMKTLGFAGAEKLYGKVMDPKDSKEFEWAAIERKHAGRTIETEEVEGWAFFELDLIDPKKGGAPRAHVDALRLLAILLAHWDNKSENQRLVCLSKTWPEGRPCQQPFLLLQDVGATFGPRKVDFEGWEKTPVWSDRAGCALSMEALPYGGGTFNATRVSEAGRQFIVHLLTQLDDAQIEDLFSGARFHLHRGGSLPVRLSGGSAPRPLSEWVRVFRLRQKQISDGPACPGV